MVSSSTARKREVTSENPIGLADVGQVADFLALSRASVYALMTRGTLPYVKLGKSRRIRWSDVRKLIDDRVTAEG